MASPTFFVAHASLTKDPAPGEVLEGWVVCRGELGKTPDIVSHQLYGTRDDAQKEAQRLTAKHGPSDDA